MTAPDHAAIVREAIDDLYHYTSSHPTRPTGRSGTHIAALAALDALVAERDEWEVAAKKISGARKRWAKRAEAAEARVAELEKALEQISEKQPETLRMIEDNGFVFRHIGSEPGNWQHLAFTIYAELCEVDTIARAALAAAGEGEA